MRVAIMRKFRKFPARSCLNWAFLPKDSERNTVTGSILDWWIAGRIRSGQVAQVVERSPEKAGVGGSTPSLATIIPKGLSDFARLRQPKVQPKVRH